jgi:hypothetical protein
VPSDVTIEVLPETRYAEWNQLVAGSAEGSVYSTPEHLDALCAAAGGRYRILVARRGDELAGGIALYERDSVFGRYVAPRLLLYYNGIVLQRGETKYPSVETSRRLKTLAALAEALATAGYGRVELRNTGALSDVRPFLARGWRARPSYSYVVPITDLAAAWARVEQNLRRLVTRCAEHGLVVTDDDDFDSFFTLHAATMERKDAAVYLPRPAFAAFVTRLLPPRLCRLFHVRTTDGRVVASQLVLLGAHPVSHTVSAAADPEFNKLGVSAYLRWKAFEALSALGYRGNDLTDAALNPVTHFKSQLGGDLQASFVLESRPTRRYQWGSKAFHAYWRARGVADATVRRVLKRSR